VALISFLVGLILAFVGSLQLQQFGASIYVANLVGVAMAREMGAIMTGIIMCGRTGAAFAAQLGSMKVNEEIAAFKTFGFNPIEFLALPRMIALALMMPLLCIFADLVGILGGMVVGVGLLDLSFSEYWSQTVRGVELRHFIVGLAKVAVFGILVAITGCLRGMQCGSSSSSVGLATTSAVVLGITCIIIADAVFAIMLNALNL
jgi:phospholipid/cholesterol/gamma-HCH transport system permease protein